ncbi:hypothetical protein E0198_005103 [Clavispora lusitaniae]|nr:hypothetical protein E0198_005103 [Clavispora lusitaniae]
MFYSHVILAALLAHWVTASGLGCYSSIDTSNSKGYNQYQTSSSCAQACGNDYPYVAVKNGGYCFCLSSMPTDETDSSDCNVKCNGYGTDMCGGASAYTVFQGQGNDDGAAAVSGSAGASSGVNSNSASAATSSNAANSSPSTSATSSSDASTTSDAATSLPDSSITSTSGQSSVTVIVTTSASGESGSAAVKTVTKTSGPSASASASSGSGHSSNKKSSNTGAIVGGVVGGIGGVAVLAAAVFFFMRRRSDDDDNEEELYEKSTGGVSRGGTSKGSTVNPVFDTPMANPFSDAYADKRASNAVPPLSDPRLNPVMMGRRRISEGSLADETDYSRKILAVANP